MEIKALRLNILGGKKQYKYKTVMSMQARMWPSNQMKDKDKMGNRCSGIGGGEGGADWRQGEKCFLQTGLFCLSSFMVGRRCPSTAPKFTNYRWNYREHLLFMVKITKSQQRKRLVGLGCGVCACAHQFWPVAVSSAWVLMDHMGQKDQFLEQEIYWLGS